MKRFAFFITTTVFAILVTTVKGHLNGGYWADYQAATNEAKYSSWMNLLDDNSTLVDINLPATHDALATCTTGSWCDTEDVGFRTFVAAAGVAVSSLIGLGFLGPLSALVSVLAGPEILRDLSRTQSMT